MDFWGEGRPAFGDYGPMPKGSVTPLARNLGPLPFWRGVERFVQTMEQVYARGATLGAAVWNGERHDFTPMKPESKTPLFFPKGRFKVDWM